ncbi:hypothetical protein [Geomonas azotofigens]|uniref:hypothetical protein n=1 Tax=Geomonas azotofigens TaxID=2843196 RepID=UPI001C116DF3|nr:hypothetical protein [Geomonas azotofigens]MBU5613030.1 hypothetical protein [Geomonas azotofigens]
MKKMNIAAMTCAAALACSAPALAIDLNGYGNIKLGTFWTQNSFYSPATGAARHDSDFSLDNFGDSFVGVKVKEGEYSGVAEVGLYNPKAYSKGVEVRLLYGEWDFGEGKLRIGKTPSPYVFRSQQVWDSDGGFNGYGSLWDGRYANIKVTMNNGFYVDAMQPRVGNQANNTTNVSPNADVTAAYSQTGNSYAATYTDYDTMLPKMVVGYEGKLNNWSYGGGVAGNWYKVTSSTNNSTPVKHDIYSYLAFFHGKVDLAPVELSYNVFTGQNTGDLMSTATGNGIGNTLANPGQANGAYYDTLHGKNSHTYGGFGQVGYRASDRAMLYAGASYVIDDNPIAHADARMASFVNLNYALGKHINIVPEIDYLNDFKNSLGQKEPRSLIAGAKWQMTF